jgi:lysozyme
MTAPKPSAGKKAGIATAAVLALSIPLAVKWEGVKTVAYLDPIGITTWCVGQTGPGVRVGDRFSEQECFRQLDVTQRQKAEELDRCIHQPLAPHEAAAILDLAFNVGTGPVCRSTLVRMVNEGRPAAEWCPQLDRWVYAGGVRWRGLANRRADARRMCEGRGP